MWFEAVHVPEEILLSEEEERLHGESLAIVAELYHGLLGEEEEEVLLHQYLFFSQRVVI